MLAVGANGTAIMAALPTMQAQLFLSSAGVQWAVNAYLVASAACIVLGGQTADWFGARLASMAGLALFGVASCIIAIADTQTTLLAGRTLQGLAAALAVPCTLAAVDGGAAPERRAAAIGAWTGFLMLGFSIGPLLGGALTHLTGWRVIFWLNALLMLVAIAGMASAGSATMRAHGTQGRRADWVGFILLATFMVALVFGLHEVPHAATAPLPVAGAFTLAAAAFALLLSVGARAEAPLVDLSFFTRRGIRDGRGHRFAVDVQHHEPAALLQPLRTEPERTRSHCARGRRLAAAVKCGAAGAGHISFSCGGAGWAAQRHDGRHGADHDRQRHHRRGHRRGRWSCWESGFSRWAPVWPCLMPRHRGWHCRLFRPRKRDRVQALSTPAPFLAAASALPAAPSRSRSAGSSPCWR